MNNKDRLFKIAADVFKVQLSSISIETNSNNIKNWDSLGMINLITEIEETFSIKFDILEFRYLLGFWLYKLGYATQKNI